MFNGFVSKAFRNSLTAKFRVPLVGFHSIVPSAFLCISHPVMAQRRNGHLIPFSITEAVAGRRGVRLAELGPKNVLKALFPSGLTHSNDYVFLAPPLVLCSLCHDACHHRTNAYAVPLLVDQWRIVIFQ